MILPVILLCLTLLSEYYIFQAVKTAFQNNVGWPKHLLNIVYVVLSLIFYGIIITSFVAGRGGSQIFGKVIFGMSITMFLGIFLLKIVMSGLLLSEDLFRAGKWITQKLLNLSGSKEVAFDYSRKKFISQLAIVAGAIPLAAMLNGMVRNAYRFKIYKAAVPVKNLPKALSSFKMVQISDLHTGSMMFPEKLQQAVDMINELKPDLVFFTGDIVNSIADEILPFKNILSSIKAKHGVFSVLGNHDYGYYHRFSENKEENDKATAQNLEKLKAYQQEMGWQLLNNENKIIDIEGHQLAIIGVENWSDKPYFPSKGDLSKAYEGCEDCAVKILLSHDPTHWRKQILGKYADINLTLSGHTHGFQFGVEIPWIKWSPAKYAYKEWAGLYSENDQHLYVNRGIGHLGYPGRIGIMPEITEIDLVG